MGGEVKGIFLNFRRTGRVGRMDGESLHRAQTAMGRLLAYAAIRMQRATSKEAVLHHTPGQQKNKACQNNDEQELQESAQAHSPFVGVHRTPGSSHSNRLSGLSAAGFRFRSRCHLWRAVGIEE
jgi:hypothetical protein